MKNEYAGIDMKMGMGSKKGGAMANNPNQGGNKAAPRGGAGKSIVSHPMVDKKYNGPAGTCKHGL